MPGLILDREQELAVHDERTRLVRLCARLSGAADEAEDLAQEALYLAWRDRGRLRDPARRTQWLAGIARNLCQDWRRRRAREAARFGRPARRAVSRHPSPHPSDETPAPRSGPSARATIDTDAVELALDDFDLEVELERRELAELLDRAMSLLPPATRAVLVERYLEERPQAQVALRLGLTEGAVEARLQRGKLFLRRAFMTKLRDSALAYGFIRSDDGAWQPTRIWCTDCGERTLVGRFTEEGRLALNCIGCRAVEHLGLPRNRYTESGWPSLFRGVHGFKPALNRLFGNVHAGLGQGIVGRTSRCFGCDTAPPLEVTWEARTGRWAAGAHCPRCGQQLGACSTEFLLLARPEGRSFWREHPRVRPLPSTEIEADGHPAILTRYQSVTDSAELAAVFRRDTFQVLLVNEEAHQ